VSQHWFDDETKNVSVLLGWDRPLQYFFCVVFPFTNDKHRLSEDYLYSNLVEPNAFDITTHEHFRDLLHWRFGVVLPEELVQVLLEDQRKGIKHEQPI
jgi:hypothetical protein